MTDKECDEQTAALTEALGAEHRVLKTVQKVLIEGLKEEASDTETVGKLWDAVGDEMDPAPEMEAAEAILRRPR